MKAFDERPDRVPCATCRPGEPCERHCGAGLRQTPGGLCKRAKGQGTDHVGFGRCDRHGGSTTSHGKRANAQKAQRAVAEFAARRDVEPAEAMLEILAIRFGMVHFLRGVLADMSSIDELKQLSVGVGREQFERPSVWVEMLDVALRECAKVAKACADMGIDERRTQMAEAQGRALDGVIRSVVDGILSALIARGVLADLLDDFRRTELPGIVQSAVSVLVFRPAALDAGGAA